MKLKLWQAELGYWISCREPGQLRIWIGRAGQGREWLRRIVRVKSWQEKGRTKHGRTWTGRESIWMDKVGQDRIRQDRTWAEQDMDEQCRIRRESAGKKKESQGQDRERQDKINFYWINNISLSVTLSLLVHLKSLIPASYHSMLFLVLFFPFLAEELPSFLSTTFVTLQVSAP